MDNLARTVELPQRAEPEGIKLLGRVVTPEVGGSDIANALHLIAEEQRKTKWDAKEKWLRFEGSSLAFLQAIRKRMHAQNRQRFGTSRVFKVVVRVEDGKPILYVPSEN